MGNYIQEYATAKIVSIERNDLIQPRIKADMIEKICKASDLHTTGIITDDEAAKIISGAN